MPQFIQASLVTLTVVASGFALANESRQQPTNTVPMTTMSVPSASTYQYIAAEQKMDNDEVSAAISRLSEQAQTKEAELAKLAEQLTVKKLEKTQSQGILAALPIDSYRVSSDFGGRYIFGRSQFHKGIDLAAPTGTPVYATGSGVVTRAGWVSGYGKFVEIDHGAGLTSRYGHNSQLHVSVGDHVDARDQIANVGCTGRCTGPHVHYEVLENGQQTDPNIHLAMATQ